MSTHRSPQTDPPAYEPSNSDLTAIEQIKAAVGDKGWTTTHEDMAPHLVEDRGLFRGRAQMVVKPKTTAEVSAVLKACNDAGIQVVPQGGNTSLCGGSVPWEKGNEIVISLARMNQVREIDTDNFTMTLEAGVVLKDAQDAASEADRYFPLSLGAEGSCMIGGNLSTNAGGTNVLKYGNARELVLGLEIVLPDGRVIEGLKGLRKDNTGYNLQHLFMGAEGTLGIITAAVVKLFPKPRDFRTTFIAVPDVKSAVALLNRARAESGDAVETFELMPRIVLDIILKHFPDLPDPIEQRYDTYILCEFVSTTEEGNDLDQMVERILGRAMEDGIVLDAAIAQNESQRAQMWKLRESASESQKLEGASIKHDISIPISSIPDFYVEAAKAAYAVDPDVRLVGFGHLGDGNLHYNLQQPIDGDRDEFTGRWAEFNKVIHDVVARYGGSISAEHGIGRLKRDELPRYKSEVELEVMQQIKDAIDPKGIMNPGKVLRPRN